MSAGDTIVAPASGAGIAAVAVIRVSGLRAKAVLETLAGDVPPPRHAALREIRTADGTLLDRGLVLWFPAPASFTGEDMAELQVHGSRAVQRAVIEAALAVEGTRLAEPGEFARRAFENGKLDLTEIEGLADLVNAETEAQRRQALAQSEGSLRRLYESWRAELVRAQALIEAGLDFADEADVVADVAAKAEPIVAELSAAISAHLADRRGMRLRDGVRVVIAGAPNAGKSSLLNVLARRDVAIVSEEAGTTRDVIEVHLDLGGIPVILTDTAGIREAKGVEAEGVRRALARVEAADIVLWLIDAAFPTIPVNDPHSSAKTEAVPHNSRQIIVLNKVDLLPDDARVDRGPDCIPLSAKTGAGIDRLVERLATEAEAIAGALSGAPAITRTRHRIELEATKQALDRFGEPGLSPELRAEEFRIAAHHLGRLTGHIDVEEVLGAIFAEFCIGK